MPVLMIVVTSVLALVAIVTMLAVAAASENGLMQRIHFDPAARPFTLTLTEAFDPEHAVLWGTQLPALLLIDAAGGRGMRYSRLLQVYERTAACYPELYEGSSFAEWLLFLERNELAVLGSHRVRMTPYGREFLRHCAAESAVAA
ncbi:MAG: hypothetical protein ACE14L_09140 [Terriglobales bacterium]